MDRTQFLAALEKRLKPLPKEERSEALSYYSEYLEEGSVEDLGSVDEIARQILDQCAVKSLDSGKKSGSLKTLWIVILSVFAAPIALPVAIALGAVMLAVFVAVFAVVLSVIISGVAVIVYGLALAYLAVTVLYVAPVNMLMTLGYAFLSLGGGTLLLIGTFYAAKFTIMLIAMLLRKLMKRGGKA